MKIPDLICDFFKLVQEVKDVIGKPSVNEQSLIELFFIQISPGVNQLFHQKGANVVNINKTPQDNCLF